MRPIASKTPDVLASLLRTAGTTKGSWWWKTEGRSAKPSLSLPHMYRSSRSVTRTVSSSRLFHSSSLCLNTVQPQPAPSKLVKPPERKDSTRPDGQPVLSERLREATALLRGHITKATGNTAINIRRRADGFTAVTQTLFSELGGQLNRATGYEEIELLKKKVEEQGMSSLTQPFVSLALHVNLPSQICSDQSPG